MENKEKQARAQSSNASWLDAALKKYDEATEKINTITRSALTIQDYELLHKELVQWIRDWFEHNGKGCNAVIGISGGKDSTICCALLCEAIGKDRVIGILMPNGVQHDIDVSKEVCEYYGIKHFIVNIRQSVDAYKKMLKDNGLEITNQTAYNIPPRVRMTTLYAFSQSLNGRVVNTSNLSEDYVGWMTLFGDAAGDFSPLSFLTVTEVRKLGHEMGVPAKWVDKAPEDGLVGTTDEEALGVTYEQIDEYITTGEVKGDKKAEERIVALINKSKFKLKPMAAYKPSYGLLRKYGTDTNPMYEAEPYRYTDKRQTWWYHPEN